eukprot:3810748-Amphidinium_carterae.1
MATYRFMKRTILLPRHCHCNEGNAGNACQSNQSHSIPCFTGTSPASAPNPKMTQVHPHDPAQAKFPAQAP